ncbi:hypothetical protein [Crocosphaera chwakensis]|uniref:Uncharacterized protein n=1 Tax=Crocosphaera chwakensis CCY0110 TaxID=391612 RepID=A3ILF1_9CHRO|nr:hypothetical protein [Crocosphaera chwakensis]EAZ92602.1 hypothetical protein CY0110_23586 [Crocosphaera chwakensis CCY0110]
MFQGLQKSFPQYWTGIYVRFLSICLVYGALVHCTNILGLGNVSWLDTPFHWRLMDIILLIFDVITSVNLWLQSFYGIIALIIVIGIFVLQILPYTVFRQFFIVNPEDIEILKGLIGTEIVLISLLVILIIARK